MARGFNRNNQGYKQTVQVRLDGVLIERSFRNEGEAVAYLQGEEEIPRSEIKRRAKFIYNNPDVEEDDRY